MKGGVSSSSFAFVLFLRFPTLFSVPALTFSQSLSLSLSVTSFRVGVAKGRIQLAVALPLHKVTIIVIFYLSDLAFHVMSIYGGCRCLCACVSTTASFFNMVDFILFIPKCICSSDNSLHVFWRQLFSSFLCFGARSEGVSHKYILLLHLSCLLSVISLYTCLLNILFACPLSLSFGS